MIRCKIRVHITWYYIKKLTKHKSADRQNVVLLHAVARTLM